MKKKVPLLESKITNLETVNANWKQVDSLRSTQIVMYKDALMKKDRDIEYFKKSLKISKAVTGGSVLISVILALTCVIK